MSKRTLMLIIAMVTALTLATTGTLAYLTSEDGDVNVMTVGKVEIVQNEQEIRDNGELDEFTQNKPILPAVYEGSEIPLSSSSSDWPGEDENWQTLEENEQVIDKFVTVTNTGSTPAYVRTFVALECPEPGAIVNADPQAFVHVNHNTDENTDEISKVLVASGVEVDGILYDVYCYVYENPLAPGETSIPSLKQLYMDKTCTNEDVAAVGSTYDVLVLSQAVQAEGFDDAEAALNDAFGEVNNDNLSDWLGNLTVGSPGDLNDNNNPPEYTEPDYVVSSTEELSAALAKVAVGEEVVIELKDGEYGSPDNGDGKIITLMGSKDAVIQVNIDRDNYDISDYGYDGSTLRLAGITLKAGGDNSGNYQGYARTKLELDNCNVIGSLTLGAEASFHNCTFDIHKNDYSIWAWGQDVTLTGCTFNTSGKAVLVYGARGGTITASNCVFNDDDGLDTEKAAFEVGSFGNASYTLVLDNCQVNGYAINPEGISTGSKLWGNKNSMTPSMLSVTVDGVKVY